MTRYPTEAERRDDLAHELRGRLLIVKPILRCPTDEEAEWIASTAVHHFRDLWMRAELNDRFLEEFTRLNEELRETRFRYEQISGAILNLIEAKRELDRKRSPIEYSMIRGTTE